MHSDVIESLVRDRLLLRCVYTDVCVVTCLYSRVCRRESPQSCPALSRSRSLSLALSLSLSLSTHVCVDGNGLSLVKREQAHAVRYLLKFY